MPEIPSRPGLRLALFLTLVWGGLVAHAALANPCADDPGGIGGTGSPQLHEPARGDTNSDGIGGTGKPQQRAPGAGGAGSEGIGGTGAKAPDEGIGGTGVVGVITGFGSICVNGIEIHYDARTPVVTEGKRIGSDTLAIGQVVAVSASGRGGDLRARQITVLHEVAGAITAVDAAKGTIRVMQQAVDTRLLSASAGRSGPSDTTAVYAPGEYVRVSGLRRGDGTIAASRVERGTGETASVMGPLARGGKDSPQRVYGVPVTMPPGQSVPEGSFVVVNGRWDGATLKAEQVSVQPVRRAFGSADRVELQGYAKVGRQKDEIRLWGQSVQLPRDTQFRNGTREALDDERKVRISARVLSDNRIVAERVTFEHDAADLQWTRPGRGSRAANPGPSGRGSSGKGDASDGEARNLRHRPEGSEERRQNEHGETHEANDNIEKVERTESKESISAERPEPAEHQEKVEPPERAEKVERPERVEKVERPEKVERVERVERPERVERIERPERVERSEKVERPERVELPERH